MFIKESMQLNEVKKEDDLFFQGPFWVVGDSVIDIKNGNYTIEDYKVPCAFNGDILNDENKTHSQIKPDDYMYYPRGRVGVYKGNAFININSILNQPDIINDIIDIFNLKKLDIHIKHEDNKDGHHYGFELK